MKIPTLPWLRLFSASVVLLISTQLAFAHGPTRQKVNESIQISASAEDVWAVIGDFGAADQWLPMVEGIESEGGNLEGATRVLMLGGDAKIFETLRKHSNEKMSYSYKIPVKTHDVAILPVNNYSSTLSVKADGDNSIVTWKGAFYRGYPNNDPPEELNDEAAVAAVTAVYQAGLTNLKSMLENK
ncbi:MAG: SRPBCC family protein [Granulosicoccus sp.]